MNTTTTTTTTSIATTTTTAASLERMAERCRHADWNHGPVWTARVEAFWDAHAQAGNPPGSWKLTMD